MAGQRLNRIASHRNADDYCDFDAKHAEPNDADRRTKRLMFCKWTMCENMKWQTFRSPSFALVPKNDTNILRCFATVKIEKINARCDLMTEQQRVVAFRQGGQGKMRKERNETKKIKKKNRKKNNHKLSRVAMVFVNWMSWLWMGRRRRGQVDYVCFVCDRDVIAVKLLSN